MQTATREETRFIQKVIVFFIIPFIVCIFLSVKFSGLNDNVKDEIRMIEKNISRYVKKKGSVPTMQQLARAKSQYRNMKAHFDTIFSFATVKPIEPPTDVIEKGVYFKKRLYLTYKNLRERAERAAITFPETIGFGEALPADTDVPLLLRKLETLDTVLQKIVDQNVQGIMIVKLLDDETYKDSEGNQLPFTEIAFRVDINCTKEQMAAVLKALGGVKPFVAVRDISSRTLKEGLLETSFVCTRLVSEVSE